MTDEGNGLPEEHASGWEHVETAEQLLDKQQRKESALAMLQHQSVMVQTAAMIMTGIASDPHLNYCIGPGRVDKKKFFKCLELSADAAAFLCARFGLGDSRDHDPSAWTEDKEGK